MMALHDVHARLLLDYAELCDLQGQYEASAVEQAKIVGAQLETALRIQQSHIELSQIIAQEAVDWLSYRKDTA